MRARKRLTAAGVSVGITVLALGAVAAPSHAVSATIDLTDPLVQTATQVAQSLVGPGVTIANVTHTGAPQSAGTFTGGALSVGFDAGVVLSSGRIADAVGPTNDSTSTTGEMAQLGDGDLTSLSGFDTNDASVLEFDFTPNGDTVYFRYVFSSEEYNEFVNTQYNDTFAFFVNGVNCATVPNPAGGVFPVTINTVNNGNPNGITTATNPDLYRDNTAVPNPFATEMDGLTIVLTCMAPVNPGVVNTMKLAIADASDDVLDSAVFLEQGSLTTVPPTGTAKVTGGGSLTLADGSVSFGTTVIKDEQGLRGNLQVNDHRSGDRFHGFSVDEFSVTDQTATWSGDGRLNGEDGYTFTATVVDNRNGNATKKGSPDTVLIVIKDGSGTTVWSLVTPVSLLKGNITVH
jgi:hypothetical protein